MREKSEVNPTGFYRHHLSKFHPCLHLHALHVSLSFPSVSLSFPSASPPPAHFPWLPQPCFLWVVSLTPWCSLTPRHHFPLPSQFNLPFGEGCVQIPALQLLTSRLWGTTEHPRAGVWCDEGEAAHLAQVGSLCPHITHSLAL